MIAELAIIAETAVAFTLPTSKKAPKAQQEKPGRKVQKPASRRLAGCETS